MEIKKPEITVVVTVYNIEKYLPRFFESMKNQTFSDFQILIIDDGSTDDSLKVCESFAKNDERIVIKTLPHVGIASARNYSMQFIDTVYAVHADGDDYVEKDYLKHLIDAIKKYDADWAISRVAYRAEGSEHVDGEFMKYGEQLVERKDFKKWLPKLFEDRRFNYLYGKIYKSELFKTICVEDDVKQGSDTMINCQYIAKINSIVLTDDLDYNYIKYNTRSVTSYAGDQAYLRLLRINNFILTSMEAQNLLDEQMQTMVYKRILLGAVWVIEKINTSNSSFDEKAKQIDDILNCNDYLTSYNYVVEKGVDVNFEVIQPQPGKKFLKAYESAERKLKRKAKILSLCPDFIKKLYRKIIK